MKVLICGSRSSSLQMMNYARQCVARTSERGYSILVGDAVGIDAVVINEALKSRVPLCVYGITPRPHCAVDGHVEYVRLPVQTFTERDQYMARIADLVIGMSRY